MQTIEISFNQDNGLLGINAARFIQLASDFSSTIYIQRDHIKLNAKSLMGVLCMELIQGTTVLLEANGEDEEEALNCLEYFLSIDR